MGRGTMMKTTEDVWQCPGCFRVITNTEFQALRFDYGCAVCKTSFASFKTVKDKSITIVEKEKS